MTRGGQVWIPYCGAAPGPHEWLDRWNLDPILLAGFVTAAAAWHFVYNRAPEHRSGRFATALALAALLFVSPFCALTSALFSVRVVHHVLLVAVLAPSLCLAAPAAGQLVRLPAAAATLLHALLFWFWHAPGAYSLALANDLVYWLMQASLLGSAALFWQAVLRARAPQTPVAALLATSVQMGLLGAILTFSAAPLYAPHFASTALWGLTPLEDQQLAGLIMWVPSAGLYLGAALYIGGRWLADEARLSRP
jgi:putative membrane protein